jgi:hypothetical protein
MIQHQITKQADSPSAATTTTTTTTKLSYILVFLSSFRQIRPRTLLCKQISLHQSFIIHIFDATL